MDKNIHHLQFRCKAHDIMMSKRTLYIEYLIYRPQQMPLSEDELPFDKKGHYK